MYHTYLTHYKEAECFASQYESLFYSNKVDFVLAGHVHAYERTHPMYQYKEDQCGPVYITIGDGGNVEGPYRNGMDEIVPGSISTANPTGVTYCQAAALFANKISVNGVSVGLGNPNYPNNGTWTPSYQLAAQPASCNTITWQGANGIAGKAGSVSNPSGAATYFCQSSQPSWSAYRDPSFGFAGLVFNSDTSATWSWYRSVDQTSTAASLSAAVDTVSYTRYTGTTCGVLTGSTLSPPPPPASNPAPPPSPALANGLIRVSASYQFAATFANLASPTAFGVAVCNSVVAAPGSGLTTALSATAACTASVTTSAIRRRQLLTVGYTNVQTVTAVGSQADATLLITALNVGPGFVFGPASPLGQVRKKREVERWDPGLFCASPLLSSSSPRNPRLLIGNLLSH